MSASTKNLTEGEPWRLILFFTLPLIAGNIFQQLYAFVDTLIVGRILGVEALAAVGCTGPLLFLIMGFAMGTTSGLSIYTGQRFGAKDEKGVRQSAAACLILTLAIAAVMTVLAYGLCRYLLLWMQTPSEIMDNAYAFISIIFGWLVVPFLLLMVTNIVRALGDSRMPTVILAFALTCNIILEPVFIMVFDWGVPGAAWAVVAAQSIGVAAAVFYIAKKVPALHIHAEDWHLTKKILWEHLRIGLPMGFQTSIIAIGAVILQVALNNLGPVAVASYAASQKVDSLALMPMMSFGMAMAAYTAQNYGARKYHRITEGVKKCIYMSVGFALVAGLFNAIFGPQLVGMFVTEEAEQVVEYGSMYLLVQGACYWVLALLFIFRSTLQGLGQSVVPTIAGVMELVMRAGAALILCEMWGFLGACWASPLAWIGSAIPLMIAYYWTRRSFRHKMVGIEG